MSLDKAVLGIVANQLRCSRSVPMPGGHGVLFPELRNAALASTGTRCPDYPCQPGVAARAYLCLAFLGKTAEPGIAQDSTEMDFLGPGRERHHAAHWLTHVDSWFAQRIAAMGSSASAQVVAQANRLDEIPHGERWRYLLQSLTDLALTGRFSDRRGCDLAIQRWHGRARDRLQRLMDRWGHEAVRAPLYAGYPISMTDWWDNGRWKEAITALNGSGPLAALAQAAYFAHVFHAHAGLWQPDLDTERGWSAAAGRFATVRYRQRSNFYAKLPDLLRHLGVSDPLRHDAAVIAAALQDLALFNTSPTRKAGLVTRDLPDCFGPYRGQGAPLINSTLARVLCFEPDFSPGAAATAGRRLEVAHALARLLADALIDPLRVRSSLAGGPGFTTADYQYLAEPSEEGMDARAPQDAAAQALVARRERAFRRIMALHFGEMARGRMHMLVAKHLRDVYQAPASVDCELCRIPVQPA